jgi:hypothetical protein
MIALSAAIASGSSWSSRLVVSHISRPRARKARVMPPPMIQTPSAVPIVGRCASGRPIPSVPTAHGRRQPTIMPKAAKASSSRAGSRRNGGSGGGGTIGVAGRQSCGNRLLGS